MSMIFSSSSIVALSSTNIRFSSEANDVLQRTPSTDFGMLRYIVTTRYAIK